MKISILISTIDEGIQRVPTILLPPRTDVEYVVSHQYLDEKYLFIPNELKRSDVSVFQIAGRGLTKSRNNAIRHAKGDICVVADDDVTYTNEYFDTIKRRYSADIDVACFKICKDISKEDYKFYPTQIQKLNSIAEHSPSSIEITFRKKSVKDVGVYFDERFGMGSWLNGGGENLFIHDCIQAGLSVWFFPEYIVNHPHDATIVSFNKYHGRRVRVGAAIDTRLNGKLAILKIPLRTIKLFPSLIRNKKNPMVYFWQSLEGYFYIVRNTRKL